MTRDILPEGIGCGANSQVPSHVFYGEGPELASGEESVKRSVKGGAVAEGREGFSRIPNGRVIGGGTVEIMLQLEKSTGNFGWPGHTISRNGVRRLSRGGMQGKELADWFMVWGRF